MASSQSSFSGAVKHALACIGNKDLVLKPKQVEVLEAVYNGSDTFVWFPTGYGKSLCYQLLPFMFDFRRGSTEAQDTHRCCVIVISPLLALMVDHVSSLRSRGVSAAILSAAILSGNAGVDKQYLASEADIKSGCFRLLYSCPEAVVGADRCLLEPSLCHTVVAVAVDEAHCVYKW